MMQVMRVYKKACIGDKSLIVMPAMAVSGYMRYIHNSVVILALIIYQPSEETPASHSGIGATSSLYVAVCM